MPTKAQISIIGGGASALFLAAFIDTSKYKVTIYEKNKTLARKFLVAGKGGFNLTHSDNLSEFINRYTPNYFLKDALQNFSNKDLVNWLNSIGIPTYIGSSKRIFPEKHIKPIDVLNSILLYIKNKNVSIKYNSTFLGWDKKNKPIINNKAISTNYTIFALGGGSWKITGSDGSWLKNFNHKGIKTMPFQASNCAYEVNWDNNFIKKHEGKPLKNIAITCNKKTQKGEVVITKFGIEGNAIYALSPYLRQQLNSKNSASISLDYKPNLSELKIIEKITNSKYKKVTDILKNDLKLNATQIGILKHFVTKKDFLDIIVLAKTIKNVPIKIIGFSNIDKAISTVGGIDLKEVNSKFELKALPNQFCIGEMLNWDAPTGGYLLQACFSMGVKLAQHLNSKN